MVKGGASDINATVIMATSKHQRGRKWGVELDKLKTFLFFELSHRSVWPKVSWTGG